MDVDLTAARDRLAAADADHGRDIVLLEGSVTDPGLPARVAEHVPAGSRCLVVEDTAHTHETTLASLQGFAEFVPLKGFFVVEDGCVDVDALRVSEDWPRGVLPAVGEWLAGAGGSFRVRSDLELYGVTCHPGGFLQRVA